MNPAIARTRAALFVVGIGVLGFGAWLVVTNVHPDRHPGLVVWLGGAIIVHDGLVAGAAFAVALAGRRVARRFRIPFSAVVVAQAGLVVALVVTALFLPEVVKQRIGTNNPTVLPLDYVGALLVFDAVVALATAAVIVVIVARSRRRA